MVSQLDSRLLFHYWIQFNFPWNPLPVGNKFYALLTPLQEASDGQELFEILTEIKNATTKKFAIWLFEVD